MWREALKAIGITAAFVLLVFPLVTVLSGSASAAVAIPPGYYSNVHLLEDAIDRLAAPTLLTVTKAQVHQESTWRTKACSPVGACGLGQMMPGTRDWRFPLVKDANGRSCRDTSAFDPSCNLTATVHYQLWHARKFQGMASRREQLAAMLASFNAGLGHILKERALCREDRDCDASRWFGHIENKCVRRAGACAESKHYARRILRDILPTYQALDMSKGAKTS